MTTIVNSGGKAPVLALNIDGGGQISSSDLLGKNTVPYFNPRDDTSGGAKPAIAFSAFETRFDKLDTRIVGISADSPQKHDKFKAQHDLTTTLAPDEDRHVPDAANALQQAW